MNIVKRKNPAAILLHCLAYWWSMRQKPVAFGFSDAFMNWRETLLPARYADRAAIAALAQEARVEPIEKGVHKITLPKQDLCFFWLGRTGSNLYNAIVMVFDPAIPHHYTTPPVRLGPDSIVVDFEPSARTADYLHQGAVLNGLEDRLTIEVAAVSSTSGVVYFEEGGSPEANRIVTSSDSARCQQIPSIALDDYCRDKNRCRRGRSGYLARCRAHDSRSPASDSRDYVSYRGSRPGNPRVPEINTAGLPVQDQGIHNFWAGAAVWRRQTAPGALTSIGCCDVTTTERLVL